MSVMKHVMVFFLLAFNITAFAHSNSSATINGITVQELDKNIGLTPGFGESTVKLLDVSGKNNLANKLVHQAIGMMHCFHYIDAVRSVRQAIREDADHVYAHIIGVFAYASFGRDKATLGFVNDNIKHLDQMSLSAKEQAWLGFAKAWTKQQGILTGTHANVKSVADAYKNLTSVAGKNDLEVMTLASWIANVHDQTVYEDVLKIDATHIGANHYLTHINESTGGLNKALKHAKAMAAMATKSGHAQHMYGHILPLVGKWKEALVQFEKTDKIHTDWAKVNNFPADYDWHYSHNNHLMAVVLIALDKYSDAAKYLELGCLVDARSCVSYSQLAIIKQDEVLLDKVLDLAVKTYPQYENYFKQSTAGGRTEILFHARKNSASDLKQAFAGKNGFVEFIGTQFIDLQSNGAGDLAKTRTLTKSLWTSVERNIEAQFARGGFDSWASGLPNVLRIKSIAKTLGLTEMVALIDKKIATRLNL